MKNSEQRSFLLEALVNQHRVVEQAKRLHAFKARGTEAIPAGVIHAGVLGDLAELHPDVAFARIRARIATPSPALSPFSRHALARALVRSSSSVYVIRSDPQTRAMRSGTASTAYSNMSAMLNAIATEIRTRSSRAGNRSVSRWRRAARRAHSRRARRGGGPHLMGSSPAICRR